MYSPLRPLLASPSNGDIKKSLERSCAVGFAIDRVRKALTNFVLNMPFDPSRLRSALTDGLRDPTKEPARLFSLGWLSWLLGESAAAESLLQSALIHFQGRDETEAIIETAYWLVRADGPRAVPRAPGL